MIRRVALKLLNIYQRYITIFSFGSCRYYPTCSEYSKWQFEENRLDLALFFTIKRVLTCNQLFLGGFDYPIVKRDLKKNPLFFHQVDKNQICIKYYLYPKGNDRYYLIKRFKGK